MMRRSNQKPVVVIGAGIGGLVSALLLAQSGERVIVLEQQADVGGKIRQLNGVDSGPTVFTMRWILDAIFEQCGQRLEDHLSISALNILARHTWRPGAYGFKNPAGDFFDLKADPRENLDAVAGFFGTTQAKQFEQFLVQTKRVYNQLEAPYIKSPRPSFLSITKQLGPRGLGVLASLGPMSSLWNSLSKYLTDPRLHQLFGRYATYCGASPWRAPATLMLIADVEMQGVWTVEGGMQSVVLALKKLAIERGVQFIFGAQVTDIYTSDDRVNEVAFTKQMVAERISTDTVVFNGDVAALVTGLLGPEVLTAVGSSAQNLKQRRSLSAVTYSVRTRHKAGDFPLVRHNLFFDDQYQQEFVDIFNKRKLPTNGTVYVCAQNRNDHAQADRNDEALLFLINAPANGDSQTEISEEELQQCAHHHFGRMGQSGLKINLDECLVTRTTPQQFHQLFPATGGALYGQASHGWFNQFQRMGATSKIKGLFLTGGSVHPGPGVPMAAMSGLRAAEAVMAHRNSMSMLNRVGTVGGTSMQSAATVNSP